MPDAGTSIADRRAIHASEVAQFGAALGGVPLGEAAVSAEECDDGVEAGIAVQRGDLVAVAIRQGGGCGPKEVPAAVFGAIAIQLRTIEHADLLDEQREEAIVAVRDAAVTVGRETKPVVRAACWAAYLFGADENIALEGCEVLAHGHGREGQGGGQLIDRRATIPLEQGEDFVLGGMHNVRCQTRAV